MTSRMNIRSRLNNQNEPQSNGREGLGSRLRRWQTSMSGSVQEGGTSDSSPPAQYPSPVSLISIQDSHSADRPVAPEPHRQPELDTVSRMPSLEKSRKDIKDGYEEEAVKFTLHRAIKQNHETPPSNFNTSGWRGTFHVPKDLSPRDKLPDKSPKFHSSFSTDDSNVQNNEANAAPSWSSRSRVASTAETTATDPEKNSKTHSWSDRFQSLRLQKQKELDRLSQFYKQNQDDVQRTSFSCNNTNNNATTNENEIYNSINDNSSNCDNAKFIATNVGNKVDTKSCLSSEDTHWFKYSTNINDNSHSDISNASHLNNSQTDSTFQPNQEKTKFSLNKKLSNDNNNCNGQSPRFSNHQKDKPQMINHREFSEEQGYDVDSEEQVHEVDEEDDEINFNDQQQNQPVLRTSDSFNLQETHFDVEGEDDENRSDAGSVQPSFDDTTLKQPQKQRPAVVDKHTNINGRLVFEKSNNFDSSRTENSRKQQNIENTTRRYIDNATNEDNFSQTPRSIARKDSTDSSLNSSTIGNFRRGSSKRLSKQEMPTFKQKFQDVFNKIASKVSRSNDTTPKLSKDEKILSILIGKKEQEERERKEREAAHAQWEAEKLERNSMTRATVDGFRRRDSCGPSFGRGGRETSRSRTPNSERRAERKRQVEQNQEQHRQDYEEYLRQLKLKQESDFQRINSLRMSKSQQNLLKSKLKTVQMEQKQEQIFQERRKSMENLCQMKKSIDNKQMIVEQKIENKKRDEIRKSRDDLQSKVEQSRMRLQQLDEEMASYQAELREFNEKQLQHADSLAKRALEAKRDAARRERIEKEKIHKDNLQRLAEEDERKNAERAEMMALKERKREMLLKEKMTSVARSKAAAHVSQLLREQIRNSEDLNLTVKKLAAFQDRSICYSKKSSDTDSLTSALTSPSYLMSPSKREK